jgi:hypothetical protein
LAHTKLHDAHTKLEKTNGTSLLTLLARPDHFAKYQILYYKRAVVVHGYLGRLIADSDQNRLKHQEAVAAAQVGVSPWQVATWTDNFLRLVEPPSDTAPLDPPPPEPPPLDPALPDAPPRPPNAAATKLRPAFNFSPLNPYSFKVPSAIEEDEGVRSVARFWVRTNACVKGRPNVKAADFRRWCNKTLIPKHMPEHKSISQSTAKHCLIALGFKKTAHSKGKYVDGHERADVVEDRKRFIGEMARHRKFMEQYEGELMYTVRGAELKLVSGHRVVLVVHDETTFHQNVQHSPEPDPGRQGALRAGHGG